MAQRSMREERALPKWEPASFGELLVDQDASGRIFVVDGLTPSQLQRDIPSLRETLEAHGVLLWVLDPTGASGHGAKFVDVLFAFVQAVEQRDLLPRDAQDLFEFVTSASDTSHSGLLPAVGGKLYNDSLCRLWTSLTCEIPAVLVVLNGHQCQPSEIKTLDHLCRFFYADPIEALTPEMGSDDEACGSLLFVGSQKQTPVDLDDVPHVVVDVSEGAEHSVREFLNDPAVVRRFVDSTGGDPARLDALVDCIPSDVQNFWLYRYDRLEPLEQALIDVLSVAAEPVAVDTLHRAMGLLSHSEYFARSLRKLTELGFVRRKIGAGLVRVHIDSADFGEAVRVSLGEERRQAIHHALADAELAGQAGDQSVEFLARHYLAAGNVAAGFDYGLQAARRLIAERSYDRAQALLDAILPEAEAADDQREIHHQLVKVHNALGNYRRALAHCGHLKRFCEDAGAEARLLAETGRLLIKIGEYAAAEERFEAAAEAAGDAAVDPQLRIEATLGQGEALYAQGKHGEAEALAEATLAALEARIGADDAGRHGLDMALIQARNLVGKIAVLRARVKQAREIFEANAALATEWGWDDEVARAEANLGLVALQEKNFTRALERLERSRQLAKSPAAVNRAYAWLNLGIVHQRKGHYGESLRHYLEGLRASRQSGDEAGYGLCAYNLVTLYQDMGAFERALSIIEHVAERTGERETRQHFIGSLPTVVYGSIKLDQRKWHEALEAFASLTDHNESVALVLPAAEAALRSVEAHVALDQVSTAEKLLADFEMPEEGEAQPQLAALASYARALLDFEAGDYDTVIKRARQSVDDAKEAGHLRDALRLQMLAARGLVALEREGEAKELLERELDALRARAERLPDDHRADFFAVPLHQDLVALAQRLDGQVPADFVVAAESDGQPAEAAPAADDPAFMKWRARYKDIIGEDPRLHQIFRILDRVAESTSPVLLQGESGTGKELIAEAVHTHSARDKGPFVKVNCAGFVEDLLLSELFGHVKGAFTGAVTEKAGRFEMADGGTIFLDEIGDISPKTQVALLRVLQEQTFEKVGGTETQQVDVRIVCATNKNLEEMVKRGEFRLDLYYRLKGVVIEVPPLRQRRQDIPRLVTYFAHEAAGGSRPKQFSRDVLQFLASYSWPGNIRELQNFVRSILLFVEGDTVEMSHVQEFSEFFAGGEVDLDLPEIDYDVAIEDYEDLGETYEDPEEALVEQIVAEGLSLTRLKKRLEIESIRRALIETGGNITQAAKILQMKRPRLSQIVNSNEELLALKEELVG